MPSGCGGGGEERGLGDGKKKSGGRGGGDLVNKETGICLGGGVETILGDRPF